MDIHEILKRLPHRYPFLLIDRILECKKDESLVAIKNVTINEPFFPGHFPHRPVMPGVLILEAMAQATGVLMAETLGQSPSDQSVYYFVGIDKARFKRPVEPGDRLTITVHLRRKVRGIWMFDSEAAVDGGLCCTAGLMCTYKDIPE